MEDFGDILYVLVMLGALVFSAIRKSKQAKRRPPLSESSSYDPMDEEEPDIEDLRDLFRPKPPVPEPVTEKVQPMIKPVEKNAPGTETQKKMAASVKVVGVGEEEKKFDFNADEIDLRKAVIYSEILNRRYQ